MLPITAEQVLAELQHHIGRENGIHVRELARRITGQADNLELYERQIRKVVEQLRSKHGHHICAKPAAGYFMAATAEELTETCLFLHERAMSSLRQICAMKNVSLPDLRGQLHLPT